MSKILDVNDLLDAASTVLTDEQFEKHSARLELAMQKLADAFAKKLKVQCTDVSYQGGFGGLCATFGPSHDGQECPPEIDEGDSSGDWP